MPEMGVNFLFKKFFILAYLKCLHVKQMDIFMSHGFGTQNLIIRDFFSCFSLSSDFVGIDEWRFLNVRNAHKAAGLLVR